MKYHLKSLIVDIHYLTDQPEDFLDSMEKVRNVKRSKYLLSILFAHILAVSILYQNCKGREEKRGSFHFETGIKEDGRLPTLPGIEIEERQGEDTEITSEEVKTASETYMADLGATEEGEIDDECLKLKKDIEKIKKDIEAIRKEKLAPISEKVSNLYGIYFNCAQDPRCRSYGGIDEKYRSYSVLKNEEDKINALIVSMEIKLYEAQKSFDSKCH